MKTCLLYSATPFHEHRKQCERVTGSYTSESLEHLTSWDQIKITTLKKMIVTKTTTIITIIIIIMMMIINGNVTAFRLMMS